jgi:RNA cap guanine-N2 methyltransferase
VAADYSQLTENLSRFYDFTGKVVLFVGAGGRQLFDFSAKTKKIIAIDRDIEAFSQLKANIRAKQMLDSVSVLCADFEDVTLSGDVAYFEFCLHEMADPLRALTHARALAPDIVVFDHSADSEWAFYAAEEDKVRRSSQAISGFGVRHRQRFCTAQSFSDYAELRAKVSMQGPVAIGRVQRFAGATNIVIPMSYELVLL